MKYLYLAILVLFSPAFSKEYYEYHVNTQDLIKEGEGCYLEDIFTFHIDKSKVNSILEIGSRDVIDAINLSDYYKCHVYAFECNPEALSICYHNRKDNPNITIVPLAAWNQSCFLTFYPIIKIPNAYNLGASSLLKISSDSPERGLQQAEITVKATRLDDWLTSQNLPTPELICMDVQGAAKQVIEGFGNRLREVNYIITEIEIIRFYQDEILYPELLNFMSQNGFVEVTKKNNSDAFYDVLFVRK